MAVHFLLSAQARTLSLKEIYKGGEEAAYETFKSIRWAANEGHAVCPRCGSVESYEITTRRKFKCAGCGHQFSVTSGTIFASRKMAFVDLLAAICIFVNAVKGLSALQLSRDLDVQYKTAFVLSHKLREALAAEVAGHTLTVKLKSTALTSVAISARRTSRTTGSTAALPSTRPAPAVSWWPCASVRAAP